MPLSFSAPLNSGKVAPSTPGQLSRLFPTRRSHGLYVVPRRCGLLGSRSVVRRARIISSAGDSTVNRDESGREGQEGEDIVHVYKKSGGRRGYNGDLLPFDLRVVSPPPKDLGRFQLDPRTHCGDIIEYNGGQFVVKRVVMHYRYGANGKVDVFRKTIEIKSLARKAIESYLQKALNN